MTRWETELVDAFLAEASAEGDVDALVRALRAAPAAPPEDLRARLLAAARPEGRFERFVGEVASMMDLDAAGARALLEGIGRPASWEASPIPDVRLYHLAGGPAVQGAITGFVSLPAGAVFPEHEHLGPERVLVIQGSFVDGVSGAVHRAGDVVEMPAGSRHDFRARPGPDLVYLVVVHAGVRIGEHTFGPNDPQL